MEEKTTIPKIRGKGRVDAIKGYINEHLSADLHAPAIAGKFKISSSTLHYLFKEHLGITYRRYVEEIRLLHAFDILQTHGTTVKEAMYASGYRNRVTFRMAFRKKFGQTPGHYRQ